VDARHPIATCPRSLPLVPSLLDFPTSTTHVCNVYVAPDGETVCCEAERSDASSKYPLADGVGSR
jgi:hypothetical protein